MRGILLLHADPIIIDRVQHELSEFDVLAVRSAYSLLYLISDPRYELLIAQKPLIKPWLGCIEGQRPAMPIMLIEGDPVDTDWDRRFFRNCVIGLTDRGLLDHLASTRPRLRSFY